MLIFRTIPGNEKSDSFDQIRIEKGRLKSNFLKFFFDQTNITIILNFTVRFHFDMRILFFFTIGPGFFSGGGSGSTSPGSTARLERSRS